MQWLKYFSKSAPNIILRFDLKTAEALDEAKKQIEFASSYYAFKSFDEFTVYTRAGLGAGALLVIESPRQRFALEFLPWLIEKNIAVTVGIRNDCIGFNHRPWEDHLNLTESSAIEIWKDPSLLEKHQLDARRLLRLDGAIESQDPMSFMAGWGELGSRLRLCDQIALVVHSEKMNFEKEIKYTEGCLGKKVSALLIPVFVPINFEIQYATLPVISSEKKEIRGKWKGNTFPYWKL